MLDLFKQSFMLKITSRVNLFLYYFKRLPLVGRLFTDVVYKDGSLKTAISILVLIINFFYSLFTKSLYIGLFLFLPCYPLMKRGMGFDGFVYLLFILNFIIGSLMNSMVLEPKRDAIVAVSYLRMPAGKYMLAQLIYQRLGGSLCFLLPLLVFALLAGGSLPRILLLFAGLAGFRFIGEAFQFFLLKRFRFAFALRPFVYTMIALLLLFAAYFSLLQDFPAFPIVTAVSAVLTHPAAVLGILLASFLLLRYYLTIEVCEKAFFRINNAENISKRKQQVKEAGFNDVKLRDKDLEQSFRRRKRYSGKSGYAYLNALFFERHRRMIRKPMFLFLAGAPAALAGLLLFLLLSPELIRGSYYELLLRIYPAFVFVIYLMSDFISLRATRAMFYNCDMSLLRYAYYREKTVILDNFKLRLKRLALINVIPSLAYGGVLLLFGWLVDPARVTELLPVAALLVVLSLFFSIHHLCMYYVLQPYTTELHVKNPLFQGINMIIYMLCYLCLRINRPASSFAYLVLAATILYSGAALFLVFRFAPKSFKVK